jgi:serine/threonine-protein kinase
LLNCIFNLSSLEGVKVKQTAFASRQNTGLLANRYQLQNLIGRGGMGEVF